MAERTTTALVERNADQGSEHPTAEDSARLAPARKSRAGVDKRTELLKAASKQFLKLGYEGSSINSLARSSGISKESIYRYFSSKEALFEAVVEKELEAHRKALSTLASIQGGDASLDQLREAAISILKVMTSDRTLSLRRLMFQAATRNPEIGEHYYRIGPEVAYEQFEDFFERLGASTRFTPKALSRAFMALLLHEIMLARACRVESSPSKERIEQCATNTVEVFERSFLMGA